MALRRYGAGVVAALVVLSACTTSVPPSGGAVDTTVPASSVWSPCGDIECAQVQVPVDYSRPDGETMSLALYRRVSTKAPDAAPVILVPDYRWGDNAREVVELAPSHLGSGWTAQTLISVSRRGSEASPMPAGNEHLVSTRDVARDLEFVRTFLELDALLAMGWGTGATALATLAITNPDSIARMVLDAPMHPLTSAEERTTTQIAADNAMVAEAMRWCVSHISCPLHANFAREFNLFRTNSRLGIVDSAVTTAVVARAARNAFSVADPQSFFTGIAQATAGNSASILATAGGGSTAGEVQIACADHSRADTQIIAQQLALNHADTSRFFGLGDDHLMYAQCAGLPEAVHPLVGIATQQDTGNVKALVIVAENDPIVAAGMSTALAEQFSWETYAVPLWRHLVVGYDDAVTQRARDFLLN